MLFIGVLLSVKSWAQPTLPDITASNENGIILLSWYCQFDGVKSIAVLHSADSLFNYSTVGFVKKTYKGFQAFADGHPYPGKNYYKLNIVFNSGLTWISNFTGMYIDSFAYKTRRINISNEELQKLIVTETTEKSKNPAPKPAPVKKVNPADRDKYMEVFKKDTTPEVVKTNFNANKEANDADDVLNSMPIESRKKLVITEEEELPDGMDAGKYIEPGGKKTSESKKKISITFDGGDEVSSFIETLPKNNDRKITLSYMSADPNDVTPDIKTNPTPSQKENTQPAKVEADKPKKISMTFKNEEEVREYIATLPKNEAKKITLSYSADHDEIAKMNNSINSAKRNDAPPPPPAPPKPKISIKFSDDMNVNESTAIKSKFISMDYNTGHVKIELPEEIATRVYSIKFFDKDKHTVVEVPHLTAKSILLDKRNFQKKGQYKFTIRRDGLELESGYVTIY